MIKVEVVEFNGHRFMHTYSDCNHYIERDNVMYSDAIDPIDSDRTYTETDIAIEDVNVDSEY